MTASVPTELLQHTARVEAREKVGENEIGEPEYDRIELVPETPFGWQPSETSFTRVGTGEIVDDPSVGWFRQDVLEPSEDEGAYLIVDDGTGEDEYQIDRIERRTMAGGKHAGTRVEVD